MSNNFKIEYNKYEDEYTIKYGKNILLATYTAADIQHIGDKLFKDMTEMEKLKYIFAYELFARLDNSDPDFLEKYILTNLFGGVILY